MSRTKNRDNTKRNRKEQKTKNYVSREDYGNQLLAQDVRKKSFSNDWKLDWFELRGRQALIAESYDENIFTIIDGASGTGKTTTALYLAFLGLKNRVYDNLIFIKNPTESGDDEIGLLPGDIDEKISPHAATTKRIFKGFMSEDKLETDIASEKLRVIIPNFEQGATYDNTIVIIDEAQNMSPKTIKLLTERCGINTKYLIMGDSMQCYAVNNRDNGFNDLIQRTCPQGYSTKTGMIGYIKLTSDENQRSDGSKFITKLYES